MKMTMIFRFRTVSRHGDYNNFKFSYRDHELTMLEFFVYLGVMFDTYRGRCVTKKLEKL